MKIHSMNLKLFHAYRQMAGAILVEAPQGCEHPRKYITVFIIFLHVMPGCLVACITEQLQ
jgi:hypothetical protein